MFHCTVFFKLAYHTRNTGSLLANRNINTFNACTFLVNDGINRYRCFTRLPVTDNQLTLITTDRYHGINRFQTNLYRLVNRLTCDNARCDFFNWRGF